MKCSLVRNVLFNFFSCEEIVSGLAQSSAHDNEHILPLSIAQSDMPSERVFKTEHVFPHSNTVYTRMEMLCSSSTNDIKKLLDLTANDYMTKALMIFVISLVQLLHFSYLHLVP